MRNNMITYKGQEIVIRGGAWADSMNRCFYEIIDKMSIDGFLVCREIGNGEVFALRGTLAE